jgi:hypothetical protein
MNKTKAPRTEKALNSLLNTRTSMYPATPAIPVKEVNEIKIAKKIRKRLTID